MMNDREGQYICSIILLLAPLLLIQGALSNETLVTTGEEIILPGNVTLVLEDVDPQSGILWIKLSDENGTIESEILHEGDCFIYEEAGLNLTIKKIYAGGDEDLVVFMATYNPIAVAAPKNLSEEKVIPEKSPGFNIQQIGVLALALIVRRLLKAVSSL